MNDIEKILVKILIKFIVMPIGIFFVIIATAIEICNSNKNITVDMLKKTEIKMEVKREKKIDGESIMNIQNQSHKDVSSVVDVKYPLENEKEKIEKHRDQVKIVEDYLKRRTNTISSKVVACDNKLLYEWDNWEPTIEYINSSTKSTNGISISIAEKEKIWNDYERRKQEVKTRQIENFNHRIRIVEVYSTLGRFYPGTTYYYFRMIDDPDFHGEVFESK